IALSLTRSYRRILLRLDHSARPLAKLVLVSGCSSMDLFDRHGGAGNRNGHQAVHQPDVGKRHKCSALGTDSSRHCRVLFRRPVIKQRPSFNPEPTATAIVTMSELSRSPMA